MKENEFDIMARNLLQHAEEPVSPRVWEGVSAALDQRSRRVPFLVWAFAGVAAAAAVVLGVFLYRPQVSPISPLPLSSSVQAVSPSEMAIVPLQQQIRQSVLVSAVALQEEPSPATPAVQALQLVPSQPMASGVSAPALRPAAAPSVSWESSAEEMALLNRMARETRAARSEEALFRLQMSGTFQGNNRGDVPSMAGPHAYRPSAASAVLQEGLYNEYPEVSFNLPVSGGVGFLLNFLPNWSLGTGIRYTNLSRTFVADYVDSDGFPIRATDVDNHQHWLGIPLNLYFHIVNKGRWHIHSFVGGAADYLLDNDFLIHSSPRDIHYHQGGFPLQWSCAVGVGVEFKLSDQVGLYLDPSFRYYFGTENQPRSIRTIQPLRVDMEAGIRFSLF